MAIALNNYQPSLALQETLALTGIFPSQDTVNGGMTIAMFHTYAFGLQLDGAPPAAGQVLNISQNIALASLIGTTYGGDGVNTFELPDFSGRSAVGDGQGPGLSSVFLGMEAGAATALLAQAQLPVSLGGQNALVDEDAPELGIRYLIRTDGIYPVPGPGGSGTLQYIGSVVKFAGGILPGGYLECNGQLLDIGLNDTLFSLIGTTYGGDGITNFALPDLRGRAVVGAGGTYALGEIFGQEDVLISQANLPFNMGGSGTVIDNREPSLALNCAIALTGLFPSPNGGADFETPFVGEIITFAGNFAPRGFALCEGQLLPINQNQALFSLLGTTYGGDGVSNFALPDLRGRTAIGAGPGAALGTQLGTEQITLTSANFPDLIYAGTNAPGTHYGGDGNDQISGLGGGDTLIGNAGNDVLDGGLGNDAMTGGDGNDTYYADSALDVVTEQAGAGAGTDKIFASVSFTIAANVEQLILTGTGVIDGTGRSLQNDSITGNGAANALFGLSGDDQLFGAGGKDGLYGGDGNDYLSGGSEDDYLSGNDGNDRFFGGAGIDIMVGGAGDDEFYVQAGDGSDVIVEYAGQGNDRILSEISYALAANSEVETLSTTQNIGTAAINLTGSGQANVIIGNNGVNILDGRGGNDILYGLGGTDYFSFSTVPNGATNIDVIADFSSPDDLIFLDDAAFPGMAAGFLAAAGFRSAAGATSALTAAQRVIHNASTGDLYYDADGAGGAASVRFANIGAGQPVFYYDFFGI